MSSKTAGDGNASTQKEYVGLSTSVAARMVPASPIPTCLIAFGVSDRMFIPLCVSLSQELGKNVCSFHSTSIPSPSELTLWNS
jgi:hypothetical protein